MAVWASLCQASASPEKGLEGVDVSCADRGVNGIGLTESAELRLRVWMNLMEPTQTGIRPSFYELFHRRGADIVRAPSGFSCSILTCRLLFCT